VIPPLAAVPQAGADCEIPTGFLERKKKYLRSLRAPFLLGYTKSPIKILGDSDITINFRLTEYQIKPTPFSRGILKARLTAY